MTHTKDNVVMLSLLGAFVIGAIVFVYIPQGRTLSDLKAEVTAEKRNLEAQTREAAIVPDLVRRVEAMQSQYPNFQRRLPKRKELGEFLREITSRLSDDGLSNQLIEPGNPTQEEFFHTLPIIMRFKGSYLALGSFMEQISRMERLTRVRKLSITSPRDNGKDLDIELQLNIYFTES